MTANGKTIYDIVISSKQHPTADDIYVEIRSQGKKMSMATVYNNLNALCEEGLIRKVITDGKVEHYDKVTRHDHLICSKCGALSDIEMDDLKEIFERQAGMKFSSYDLKLYHVCEKCREEIGLD